MRSVGFWTGTAHSRGGSSQRQSAGSLRSRRSCGSRRPGVRSAARLGRRLRVTALVVSIVMSGGSAGAQDTWHLR